MAAGQRGMVLIIILFIVALVTLLATGMASEQNLNIRRVTNVIEQNDARSYAVGGEYFARTLLTADWQKDKAANEMIDHAEDAADEAWGTHAILLPIDMSTGIEGQLDDLMGRLNLNALVDFRSVPPRVNIVQVERLRRLLATLPGLEQPPLITPEVFVDWIDRDQESYQFRGAEDETYLSLDPPYRTADGAFDDISELLLLKDMDAAVYNALLPYVTVLPAEVTQINVNSASDQVLAALIPGLTLAAAGEIVAERKRTKGFRKPADFLQLPALAGMKNLPVADIRVHSNYFQAIVRAFTESRSYRMVSKLYRDNSGNTAVMRRDFGKRLPITKEALVLE